MLYDSLLTGKIQLCNRDLDLSQLIILAIINKNFGHSNKVADNKLICGVTDGTHIKIKNFQVTGLAINL